MAKPLRFDQIRMARRVLDMKCRTAAGILGIPYADLRKGERFDALVPVPYLARARQLIELARRGRKTLGNSRCSGSPDLRAVLPFDRPHCLFVGNRFTPWGPLTPAGEASSGISCVRDVAAAIGRAMAPPIRSARKAETGRP